MVKINYACDVHWDKMDKKDETTRSCSSCKRNVHDFTKQPIPEDFNGCGRFNLSQVSSFNSRVNLPNIGIFSASLLAFLGLSLAPMDTMAQNNSDTSISVSHSDTLLVNGLVKDKITNAPLEGAMVKVLHKSKVIQEMKTGPDGTFNLEIDTSNYQLVNMEIHFHWESQSEGKEGFQIISGNLLESEIEINLESMFLLPEIEIKEYITPLISPYIIAGTVTSGQVAIPKKKAKPIDDK